MNELQLQLINEKSEIAKRILNGTATEDDKIRNAQISIELNSLSGIGSGKVAFCNELSSKIKPMSQSNRFPTHTMQLPIELDIFKDDHNN